MKTHILSSLREGGRKHNKFRIPERYLKKFEVEWGGVPFFKAPELLVHWNVAEEHERKASWHELFYDLVYVAAIIQLGNAMKYGGLNWGNLMSVIAQYIFLYQHWTDYLTYNTRFTSHDLLHKFHDLAQIIGMMGITIHIFTLKEEDDFISGFALSSSWLSLHLAGMYALVYFFSEKECWRTAAYMIVCNVGAMIITTVAAFAVPWERTPKGYSAYMIIATFIWRLYVNNRSWASKRAVPLPIDIVHHAERLGLQIMILLGESLISLASVDLQRDLTFYGYMALAICLVYALQSIYYDAQPEQAMHHAARRKASAGRVFFFSHYFINVGLLLIGVGFKFTQDHSTERIRSEEVWLLSVGVTLYLFFVMIVRMSHNGWKSELGLRKEPLNPIARHLKHSVKGAGMNRKQVKHHQSKRRDTLVNNSVQHQESISKAVNYAQDHKELVNNILFDTEKEEQRQAALDDYGLERQDSGDITKSNPEVTFEEPPSEEASVLSLVRGQKIATIGTTADLLVSRRRIIWGCRFFLALCPLLININTDPFNYVQELCFMLLIVLCTVLLDQFDVQLYIRAPDIDGKSMFSSSDGGSNMEAPILEEYEPDERQDNAILF
eukprot:m.17681 g.17681  ORF g.17681 m.17681 type:complete len:609 (-) comp6081_c0_seq1:65-1891(-)